MKSPYADCELVLKSSSDSMEYRGEVYDYMHYYYECPVSKERLVTTEIDSVNMHQVEEQYRAKYGIIGTEDIVRYRNEHGLSIVEMAKMVGVDSVSYEQFELGLPPTKDEDKAIRAVLAQ